MVRQAARRPAQTIWRPLTADLGLLGSPTCHSGPQQGSGAAASTSWDHPPTPRVGGQTAATTPGHRLYAGGTDPQKELRLPWGVPQSFFPTCNITFFLHRGVIFQRSPLFYF
ncbi:uncharacterized protein LOC143024094 isoform X4 [Oratosquilla oratoria]|uniref:uncharacterized protein LOC143024094 isoform X4 n=1 Tax=Oratosquilla oratoria TaxID=337810 RepID=UPI003F762F1B